MKEAVLYRTDGMLLQEVIHELEKRDVPYRLTDQRFLADDSVLFVILDHLLEEDIAPFYRNAPDPGGIFFFHRLLDTLLVGPMHHQAETRGCLACLRRKYKDAERESLLSLLYNETPESGSHPQAAGFVADCIQNSRLAADSLLRYEGCAEHIHFDALRAERYLLNGHEACPVCSAAASSSVAAPRQRQTAVTVKPNRRTYRLRSDLGTDAILRQWFDPDGGTITHRYRELRSSYIEAGGMEIRIGPSYVETGFGRAYRRPDAEKLAVLEALERYCGMCDRTAPAAERYSYEQLSGQAVDPAVFGLHSAETMAHPAYKLQPYKESLPVYWTPVFSMKERRQVLVPEQLVYFADGHFRSGTNRFVYDSSNGLALGNTWEEAALHGLFEVIERDNFLCAWYNRLPLQEIDISGSHLEELKQLIYFMELEGIQIRFFDISMELKLPSVWALAYDTREGAGMKAYNAAAAHVIPEKAVESAAMEVITSLPIYAAELKEGGSAWARTRQLENNPGAVTEFEDHVLYYASESNCLQALDFVLREDGRQKASLEELYPDAYDAGGRFTHDDLAGDLEELAAEIIDHYGELYIADVTPDEVAGFGYSAAKVLVPGMLPMTFGEQHRRVILERLTRERERRGLDKDFTVNPYPHPFP
ncbi:YcaO-like family protein [Paenibacillus sp. HN-1]|uniref:YcaO-like family protein n=1 Tax=Paenibacillus TaxID=44249 RepID=UPI001CA9BF48|nr:MULTISPECIES: YcaO-like family protein [Paenibacillus]MBY9077976.1 YcaO-like family protein [Paenibacillus sp. CGMCC 1.18879]MBY9083920.1 YcaO-like family protein [Paenibacillus sinensis]